MRKTVHENYKTTQKTRKQSNNFVDYRLKRITEIIVADWLCQRKDVLKGNCSPCLFCCHVYQLLTE